MLGNCSSDNEAGIVYLQSPVIALPAGTAPKIAFDHNVATEASYDGANLKISVNGGAYTLVPAAAFIYNPYNGTLVGSDNPMSGEAAFNGTDDGSLSSAWGQSQIDLTGVANPGDTVQLRFEVGMDGCNGLVGWYVDDVSVYSCAAGGVDSDSDGVPDDSDNCIDVANADQFDSNGDSIGNACDADITGPGGVEDCLVNFVDLQGVKDAFFSNPASPVWNPHADFDNSGQINFTDLQILKGQFFGPPGPSAAGCN